MKLKQNGSREIRLFISSTFRDMNAERDYLVRFVFPRIREALMKYRLQFVDIDLRWGISSEENIVGTCRSIIEQCHPLFLGILGGRYGWIPEHMEKDISITEDEIEHAISVFQDSNYQGMFFLFREDETTGAMVEEEPGEYCEPAGSEKEAKLLRLKTRIREAGFHVDSYRAAWNNEMKALSNLSDFGELVYDYIINFVRATYGDLPEEADGDEAKEILELYINDRTRFFIDDGLTQKFHDLNKVIEASAENNRALITGDCGTGKSAFLCKFIEQSSAREDWIILPHFIGVIPGSNSLDATLRRLCGLLARYSDNNEPLPYLMDKLIQHFQNLLAHLRKDKQYVLILDGLNQLDIDGGTLELNWLPNYLPPGVTLIFSCIPGEFSNALRSKYSDMNELELTGLSQEASHKMMEYYLSYYQKKLTKEQSEALLIKKDSSKPLYLMTAIEELRMYNDYFSLTEFIKSMPDNSVGLLEWIIDKRISGSREFTTGYGKNVSRELTRRFLSFLYISRSGLSEAELLELLGTDASNGNLAALMRRLRPFLALRGQYLSFYHDDFRKAVEYAFIQPSEERIYHAELAQYFQGKADPEGNGSWKGDQLRYYELLIYHLLRVKETKKVIEMISDAFLKGYQTLSPPALFLRDIRSMVELLAEDETKNYENSIILCLRYFSNAVINITNLGDDQPHPLEIAIIEGKDADADEIISASKSSTQTEVLKLAAYTLYLNMGRFSRAAKYEGDISEAKERSGGNLATTLLYNALLQRYQEEKAKEEKTEEEKTEEEKTEEEKTEEEKTEEVKTEVEKTEDEKTEEEKTEDEKTEVKKTEVEETKEEKNEVEKTEAEKTKDEKTEVTKTEVTKTEVKKIEVKKTKDDMGFGINEEHDKATQKIKPEEIDNSDVIRPPEGLRTPEIKELENKDVKQKNRIKEEKSIAFTQFLLLTAVGKARGYYAWTLGIFLMVLGYIQIDQYAQNMIDFLKKIPVISVFAKYAVSIVWMIGFGLPILILLSYTQVLIHSILRKTSRKHLQAMVLAARNSNGRKRLTVLYGIARYCRLLQETELNDKDWYLIDAAQVMREEIVTYSEKREYETAGLLAACSFNLGAAVQNQLVEAFSQISGDIRYEVLNSVINHNKVIQYKNLMFYTVMKVYNENPPIPLFLKLLELLEENDKNNLQKAMEGTGSNILAVALLRSLKHRKQKKFQVLEYVDAARKYITMEPVRIRWYEWLVYLLFAFLQLPILALISLLLVSVLILAVFLVPAIYFLWYPCIEWRDKQKVPADRQQFIAALTEHMNSDKITEFEKYYATSVVETAVIELLQRGSNLPGIFPYFRSEVIVKAYKQVMKPGFTQKTGRMLAALLDAGAELPKILKVLKPKMLQKGHILKEAEKEKQWKRIKYQKGILPRLKLLLILLIIGGMVITPLYLLGDAWVKIWLVHRIWLIVTCILAGMLVTIPVVRYLIIGLPFLFMLASDTGWFLEQETNFLSVVPMLCIILANEIMRLWHCSRLLYPSRVRVFLNKILSASLTVAGSIAVFGVAWYLTMGSVEYEYYFPEKAWIKEMYYLKDYSILENDFSSVAKYAGIRQRLKDNPDPGQIADIADRSIDWYNLLLGLQQYHYDDQAAKLTKALSDYAGWCYIFSDANVITITDDKYQKVYPCVVVTYLFDNALAKQIGLERGDIIFSVNGNRIYCAEDYLSYFNDDNKGKTADITVRRGLNYLKFKAVPEQYLGANLGYIVLSVAKKE